MNSPCWSQNIGHEWRFILHVEAEYRFLSVSSMGQAIFEGNSASIDLTIARQAGGEVSAPTR
jgi:hypothetical protein